MARTKHFFLMKTTFFFYFAVHIFKYMKFIYILIVVDGFSCLITFSNDLVCPFSHAHISYQTHYFALFNCVYTAQQQQCPKLVLKTDQMTWKFSLNIQKFNINLIYMNIRNILFSYFWVGPLIEFIMMMMRMIMLLPIIHVYDAKAYNKYKLRNLFACIRVYDIDNLRSQFILFLRFHSQ